MSEQEIPADLYYAVYDQLEYDKDPGCGEEAINIIELVRDHYQAQAWQDGHDTALLHGQNKNPYLAKQEAGG